MSRTSIQDVLCHGFAALHSTTGLPSFVVHAAQRMMACRTARLGGHVQRCPQGHVHRVWYNSCRHRACPLCAWSRLEAWLARQKARLIHCRHYHVVFTIPHELHPLWRYNRTVMADLLFGAVRGTLFKLLDDPQYLGARPGLIAALHTWTKQLVLHPHIHCLVTGGGLTEEGRWLPVVKDCLLPRKVLMVIFRGKYLDALRHGLARGEIRLPPDMRAAQARGLLNKLGRHAWNVKILERYDQGRGVLTYLARYLRGGPISTRRLSDCRDGEVRFRWRDSRELDGSGKPRQKMMTLPVTKFLLRLLQHVPPPRMHMVRTYGLYASSQAKRLEAARSRHGQRRIAFPTRLLWQDLWQPLGEQRPDRCPVCGAVLERFRNFAASRGPPNIRSHASLPAQLAGMT